MVFGMRTAFDPQKREALIFPQFGRANQVFPLLLSAGASRSLPGVAIPSVWAAAWH
jgi:hypothetical protein